MLPLREYVVGLDYGFHRLTILSYILSTTYNHADVWCTHSGLAGSILPSASGISPTCVQKIGDDSSERRALLLYEVEEIIIKMNQINKQKHWFVETMKDNLIWFGMFYSINLFWFFGLTDNSVSYGILAWNLTGLVLFPFVNIVFIYVNIKRSKRENESNK